MSTYDDLVDQIKDLQNNTNWAADILAEAESAVNITTGVVAGELLDDIADFITRVEDVFANVGHLVDTFDKYDPEESE